MRTFLLPAALSLLSCYNPDYDAARFACAPDGGTCPDNYICSVRNLCERPDAAPCPRGGQQLAKGVYACLGAFPAGAMDTVCGPGHHACDARDVDKITGTVRKRCEKVPGFYTSKFIIKVNYDDKNNLFIDCEANQRDPGLLGCGAQASEDGLVSVQSDNACQNLILTFPCSKTSMDWHCMNGVADAAHKNTQRGGALCCQD